jgi:hypothetical protein
MSSPFKFLKRFFFDQFMLGVDSGGGGGPTSSTVTQSNIPDWLRPQVEGLLGGATKQFFDTKEVLGAIDPATGERAPSTYEIVGSKPFTPYSTNARDYVAGFSPLQEQVQYNAANLQMPGQFNEATGYANQAAQGGIDSAQRAYGYGNAGFQSGQLGQQLGMQGGQYYGDMGAGYGAQGAGYGAQAAGLAPQAQQYGQQAADIGQMGLRAEQYGRNVSGQAEDYARQAAGIGDLYGQMATSPDIYKTYMSPYQENVTDVQLQGLQRQADIARTQRGAQAARAGAFGGARQAIENAEANRALASQQDAVRAQGLQQAYQQAQANIGQRAQLGLQGLQGAQQGLGTALQGGQLGLSGIGTAMQGQQAGMQGLTTANQLYGTGIQGSQAGMQGAGLGLQGVDRQLAGTAQGMQGAGMGLQGVQGAQAGYGLANQAAGNLANIGTQQLGAQTGILSLQNQVGAQQQAQEQRIIDNAINNYAQAQNAPLQNFNNFNALLRGYAVPGTTSTQYSAAPSLTSQVVGGGTALLAGNKILGGAGGGRPQDFRTSTRRDGLDTLAMYKTMRGLA